MAAQLLQHFVRRQADSRPDATALVYNERRVTYLELEEQTNRLARILREAGLERGDRVCLLLPKSIPAIVGILGTLKADGVYVPMDITSPAARLSTIIESCESRFVLASPASGHALEQVLSKPEMRGRFKVGWMDSGSAEAFGGQKEAFNESDIAGMPESPVNSLNQNGDVAHILFTSGSTGVPKGVMIPHSTVLAFVNWATRYFAFRMTDRISGHPPLHFDLSTFDIYGTLKAGAELHLVPPEMSLLPHKLAEMIREHELTQWFSVPSLLNYMAKFDVVRPNDFPSLKRLLWCGEAFPTPALIYWMTRLPRVEFTNLYGPTEATIASSYYTVPSCPTDETAPTPIGTPCEGEDLLVLNEQLEPVAPGITGDLYIAGAGLSPGYWRDPEKTAAVFLTHPRTGERIYKTGDLASVGEDGLVYLHGRADSQIKSRGYRIELGEIEAALHSIPGLRESAVVAVDTGGFEGATICCAFVPADGMDVEPADLRTRLGELLPRYMVPSQWARFDTLPLNGSGKIDRRRLKEHFQSITSRTAVAI